jgi:RNA polymerase sigma factor (TIGR02999 family)
MRRPLDLETPAPMPESDLVDLISKADSGDPQARERLFAVLYRELRAIAERELRRHSSLTLNPTTLLHETFLNLSHRSAVFADRGRFLAYASVAMRGLVIDYMRGRMRQKRGGGVVVDSLDAIEDVDTMIATEETDYEYLSEALEQLSLIDPRLAECVDLKFFCGFSFRDIAQLWQVSERTVHREWGKARILLHRLLHDLTADRVTAA